MQDAFGRNIRYLRISVTDRCNLRCRYCMPPSGMPVKLPHERVLRNEEIIEIARVAAGLGINKIRLTGGEPLVRKGIVELVSALAALPGIEDLALTTNATLLGSLAQPLKDAGLRRINVSLDTLNPARFGEMTRGGDLAQVFQGLEAAEKAGLWPIRVNSVLIGGDNVSEIRQMAELTVTRGYDVRFIELMPIGEAAAWTVERFVSTDVVLQALPELKPDVSKPHDGPARYYRMPGARGRIGLIQPVSCNFCADCDRIRLTADGKLKPCLHSNDEIDLLEMIRSGGDIEPLFRMAVGLKQERHQLDKSGYVPIVRSMNRIGG
ncbi:MAG: GTP 3',8-cyclase MoaA [Erysipelotrichaceae bacterium]|nr:GTP 3',8-cyclase MoaA [Erysipelotrichaceae bacterium]